MRSEGDMKRNNTQEAIAAQIGVCRSWASLIINGHSNASFSLAKKIGLLTDTSPLIWMETDRKVRRDCLGAALLVFMGYIFVVAVFTI